MMTKRFRIDSYQRDEFTQGTGPEAFYDDLEAALEPLTDFYRESLDGAAPEEPALVEDLYDRVRVVVDTEYGFPVRVVSYVRAESGKPVAVVFNPQDGSTVRVEQEEPARKMRFEQLSRVIDAATPADLVVLTRMLTARQGKILTEESTSAKRRVQVEMLENHIARATQADLDVLVRMVEQARSKHRTAAVAVSA